LFVIISIFFIVVCNSGTLTHTNVGIHLVCNYLAVAVAQSLLVDA